MRVIAAHGGGNGGGNGGGHGLSQYSGRHTVRYRATGIPYPFMDLRRSQPLRPFNVFPYCFESRLSQSSLRFVNENDYFILHTMDSQSNRLICVLGPFRFLVRLFSLFFLLPFVYFTFVSAFFSYLAQRPCSIDVRAITYNNVTIRAKRYVSIMKIVGWALLNVRASDCVWNIHWARGSSSWLS